MCTDTAAAIEKVTVVANVRVASGVGHLVLDAPRTAASVRPGQFVHLRIAENAAFILRRPFSIFRAGGGKLEILYQVLGTGTRALSLAEAGERMDLIGPLGHGWEIPAGTAHALLVAGGLGVAPMGMLAEELARVGVAATLAQGAPNAARLLAGDVFDAACRRVETATDDGSAGTAGYVTVLVERLLEETAPDVVYVCGPEVMERTVANQASAAGIACQVSLERLMACGVGACLSCVVTTKSGRKRACVDGPVFDAAELVWSEPESRAMRT